MRLGLHSTLGKPTLISDDSAFIDTHHLEQLTLNQAPSEASLHLILKHPELYAAYPELSGVAVLIAVERQAETAKWDAGRFAIEVTATKVSASFIQRLKTKLLSEVQKAIDDIERLPNLIKSVKKNVARTLIPAMVIAASLMGGMYSTQAHAASEKPTQNTSQISTQNSTVKFYQDLIAKSELAVLKNGVAAGFAHNVKLTTTKNTETVSEMNEHDVAISCEITLNQDHNDAAANLMPTLTHDESMEFIYIHEQAHCADYAGLLQHTENYHEASKSSRLQGRIAESVVNESFADAYALLVMMAKNPSKAEVYFNAISQLRNVENTDLGNQEIANDHLTTNALSFAFDSFNFAEGKLVFRQSQDKAITEQALAIIAGEAASYTYSTWLQNQPKEASADHLEKWRESRKFESVQLKP